MLKWGERVLKDRGAVILGGLVMVGWVRLN